MKGKRAYAVLSVGCGVACAFVVAQFMGGVQAKADGARAEAMERYGGEQAQVCVATRDISPGEQATTANTSTKPWLVDMLPYGAVHDRSEVDGLKATSATKAGEVLNSSRFGEADTADVPDGMCGVGVEVKDAQSAGPALESGRRVDVYVTGQGGTKRVCQDAPVVSAESVGGHASWVTLAVRPSQVQEVLAASKNASLSLVVPGEGVDTQQAAGAEPVKAGEPNV